MADFIFNNARGRLRQLVLDGADLIVVLLKTDEADDTLNNYDTLDALLAAGGGTANVECDFTNYARKVIDNGDISPAVDDGNNRLDIDIPDQTYTSAGGASNNNIVSAIICIDGVNDAARIPVSKHDFIVTTDGTDLSLQVPAAGFYRSA